MRTRFALLIEVALKRSITAARPTVKAVGFGDGIAPRHRACQGQRDESEKTC